MEEITIYEQGNIKITNLRAVFEGKTFSVSNITSVEAKRVDPSSCLPVGILIAGFIFIALFFNDMRENIAMLIAGIVFVGLFIVIQKASKPTWVVSITTSSGEEKAYTSPEQETIQKIVESLNNAIVQKG